MFKQLEYSEIFKNSLRMFNRCTHDEGSTYNDLFSCQPSDKGIVSDAQQVIVFVNTSKNIISVTVINSFTVFMFYLVKIFQFYSFIVL